MATDLWNAVCNDKLEGHDREQQRQHNVDSISEVVLGKRKRGEPMNGNHGNQEAVDALVRRMQWKTHASVTCTSAQVHETLECEKRELISSRTQKKKQKKAKKQQQSNHIKSRLTRATTASS
jgi:hypothetical protein